MNISNGGIGGIQNEEHAKKFHTAGGKVSGKKNIIKINSNPEITKNRWKNFPSKKGSRHSEETKKKMSLSQQGKQKGEKNSQYGTCWITNGKESKKIKKEDLIPNGWKLGRKIIYS